MAQCKKCGKKGLFLSLFYHDDSADGLCSACYNAEIERIEAEKQAREDDFSNRLLHMKDLYEVAHSFEMEDGLEAASVHVEACKNFDACCKEALADTDFLSWAEQKDKQPFSYYSFYAKDLKDYLEEVSRKVFSLRLDIDTFIWKSKDFKKVLLSLPHVPVELSECSYEPDDDPDYSNVKFSSITKKTVLGRISEFCVVDVETTGLNPFKNEIVQLSAIKFQEFEPVDCFTTYIKPIGGINADAARINGITDETVKDAPTIDQAVNAFRAYIGDKRPIVGHNLIFDLKFLCNNCCISLNSKRKYFDTLELSRRAYRSDKYRLDYLDKAALYICRDDAHDSLSDCLVTGMLFHDICKTIQSD